MTYHWNFASVIQYRQTLYEGLGGTLQLGALSLFSALVIGILIGVLRTSEFSTLRNVGIVYVGFFRNIPFLVQLFWFYYAIPVLTGIQAKPFVASWIALSLYGGAYFGEIYRAGIQSIEKGQWEAARAIGLGYIEIMRNVVMPQAIQRMIPPLTTQAIELVKLTTVASTIAYFELLYSAKLVSDQDLRPLEAYTAVAFILISLLLVLSFLAARLERRLRIAR
jgi:polar amino acid transport system permease protein